MKTELEQKIYNTLKGIRFEDITREELTKELLLIFNSFKNDNK